MSGGERFKDKVAIVTGGCCGIGRGCADVFVENGGKVAVLDINDAVGASLNKDCMYYIHCDMSKEDEIKAAVEETVKKYGQIDCLVNNVGKIAAFGEIDDVGVDDFKDLLNINLISHFTASKYSLPYLRQTKGSIVNIGSISGHSGMAMTTTYAATKGGTVSLAKALAIDEAKHGVRVNSITPSLVDTPMARELIGSSGNFEEAIKLPIQYNHLKRMAEPKEIGLACLFLAVDATFTTGEELMCSGGFEIGYGIK